MSDNIGGPADVLEEMFNKLNESAEIAKKKYPTVPYPSKSPPSAPSSPVQTSAPVESDYNEGDSWQTMKFVLGALVVGVIMVGLYFTFSSTSDQDNIRYLPR